MALNIKVVNKCFYQYLVVTMLLGYLNCEFTDYSNHTTLTFVNITDSIIFHINGTNPSHTDYIDFRLMTGGSLRRRGLFNIRHKTRIHYFDLAFTDRVLVQWNYTSTEVTVSIENSTKNDSGYYYVTTARERRCHTVYILDYPSSIISAVPTIEESNTGQIICNSVSTTLPNTHNLSLVYSWYANGETVETSTKYLVDGNKLYISFVNRYDTNLSISCKTQEEMGLSSSATTTLQVTWGPDPVLVLQPSVSLYFVSLGEDIPDVRCRVDCNPDCEITWKKSESQVILSQIDTLSLGKSMRNSTGEYICTATRTGTFKKGRASFFVKVHDEPENNMSTKADNAVVAALGGILALVLLLSIMTLVLLLRTKKLVLCKSASPKNESIDMQNHTTYEDLAVNRDVAQNYESVSSHNSTNLPAVAVVDNAPRTREENCYENNAV